MDHYFYPIDPIYPPLRVPHLQFHYLSGRNGDCSVDFSSFPSRNGWDKAEFLDGELRSGRSPQDASAFLQAWLFFGLASSVLGLPPQPEHMFVVRDTDVDGNPTNYVSTKALPQMIQSWTERVLDYDSAGAEKAIRTASMILDEASLFSQAAAAELDGFRLEKLHPDVRLSIIALGDQFQATLRQLELKLGTTRHKFVGMTKNLFGANTFVGQAASKMDRAKSLKSSFLKSGWRDPYSTEVQHYKFQGSDIVEDLILVAEDRAKQSQMGGPWHWGTSAVLRKRMLDAGWCAYEAARLQDILSPWAVHYASAMRRPIMFDHSACTELHCQAHTIDESTYSTQHVADGCACEFVGPPQDEVKQILKGGGFPVLRFVSEPGSSAASIIVRDHRTISDYDLYALSHVWSHGLGNATDNTMPACQITRLLDVVGRDEFHKERASKWLWVDTLCVPLDREYRKLAISKLSEVYFSSLGSLVVDKELTRTRCQGLGPEEVLLRVFCSSWMQRMWTMQEGASSHVHVVFADGQMDLKACMRRFQLDHPMFPMAKGGDTFNIMTQMVLAREVPVQSGIFSHQDSGDFQVMRVWNGMRWRQATKRGDEAIILATLLFAERFSTLKDYKPDIEALNRLLHMPMEQRWAALFQARKTWPQGIVFVNCKTIPEKGLRWAPREVGTYGREISDNLPGLVTPRGLVIKRPGYMFLALRTRLNRRFEFLDVATSDWYSVSPMDEEDIEGWPEPGHAGGSSFVLVQSKRQAGYANVTAVIGRVEDIVEGVIHIEFSCKVRVAKAFNERKQELDRVLVSSSEAAFGPQLIRTARYEEEQMWCIG